MVLQLRDDDLIAGSDRELAGTRIAQDIGHLVQSLGGVLGERDFVIVGADERRDVLAGIFVGVRGFFSDLVCPAVHRGIVGG